MRRIVLVPIAVLVAYMALIGWDRWVNAHRIMAGPDNESPFYQGYDPEQVIKKFRYEGGGFGAGHGDGASQLIKRIEHHKGFSEHFTMQAARERELLKALREDIMFRLRITGTAVLASHDETGGGFLFKYASGKSVGSVSVRPPLHQTVVRGYALPNGLDDVDLNISLEETWTRGPGETSWWMAMVD